MSYMTVQVAVSSEKLTGTVLGIRQYGVFCSLHPEHISYYKSKRKQANFALWQDIKTQKRNGGVALFFL